MTLGGVLLCLCAIGGQLVRLGARSGPEIRVDAGRAAWRAAGRGPTSSIATAGCWRPTSPSIRSMPIRSSCSISTRRSRSSPPRSPASTTRSCASRSPTAAAASSGWRAGLRPRPAQSVHELGLPGLAFRPELKRAYPLGTLAGHVLGTVNIDNKGRGRHRAPARRPVGWRRVQGPGRMPDAAAAPVPRHRRAACAGRGAEARRRAIRRRRPPASCWTSRPARSWPPSRCPRSTRAARRLAGPARTDRLAGGTFELGSVFKTLTIAMALEAGHADLDKIFDVRQPLAAGTYTIKDLYPQGRPLTVREIFLHSSNVGAGMLALEAGAERQRGFPASLGLPSRCARRPARRAAAAAASTGARSRPSPSPTATAWPWRRCSSPPRPRRSSTAARR